MSKHYVAMSGDHGYMPDFCGAYETFQSAVIGLVELHEFSKARQAELEANGYIELGDLAGADYCEILDCDCDDADCHND